jgi:hypothetical protein
VDDRDEQVDDVQHRQLDGARPGPRTGLLLDREREHARQPDADEETLTTSRVLPDGHAQDDGRRSARLADLAARPARSDRGDHDEQTQSRDGLAARMADEPHVRRREVVGGRRCAG